MKLLRLVLASSALALFAGCWTFNETPYPKSEIASAPEGTNIVLGVNGFLATVVEYTEYTEFRTIYVPGFYGRHHYHPGYLETIPTVSYLPQSRTTDQYLLRAKDSFERAGFTVGAATPDWTVEVTFSGPFATDGDEWREFLWPICSIFFCDYGSATWKAQLRVRDNRSGRLVFHRDYSQRYETNVFGLVPLFSIAAAAETSPAYMQSWCLAALTDQAVADAARFFAGR